MDTPERSPTFKMEDTFGSRHDEGRNQTKVQFKLDYDSSFVDHENGEESKDLQFGSAGRRQAKSPSILINGKKEYSQKSSLILSSNPTV